MSDCSINCGVVFLQHFFVIALTGSWAGASLRFAAYTIHAAFNWVFTMFNTEGKIMKKIAIVALLSAFVAAPAFAADTGPYIGASVGRASSDLTGSKSPVGFALQGGYQFNKNFAVEAQYADFGQFAPIGSLKGTSLSASAVGILPFNAEWSGYGRLGYASVDSKVSGSGLAGGDGTYKKSGLTYGIGGQFNATQALGIRFGVDQYKAGGTQGAWLLLDNTITAVSLGVVYKF
jgi:OOP family OmpA-OmpF porin